MAIYSSTRTTRVIAIFAAACVLMMNMVFVATPVQAAATADDHHHAQDHAQNTTVLQHDCVQHGDESPDAKAHAGGCHNGACCYALSADVVVSSTVPQQHLLQSFFQPMLIGIVLPTDVRPPISAA